MAKILVLKARKLNKEGRPAWHDRPAIDAAIRSIIKAKGDNVSKMGLWLDLAMRIEVAADAVGYGERGEAILDEQGKATGSYFLKLPNIAVEITNLQAKQLWKELDDLKPEGFFEGGQCRQCGAGIAPRIDAAYLNILLKDVAAQLGFPVEEQEDEEEKEKA